MAHYRLDGCDVSFNHHFNLFSKFHERFEIYCYNKNQFLIFLSKYNILTKEMGLDLKKMKLNFKIGLDFKKNGICYLYVEVDD